MLFPLAGGRGAVIKLGELVMILDLHRQGLSVSAIARQLCVDRKTVRSAIARGLEPPKYKTRPPRIAALKAQMQAFKAMEVDVHAAPDQQISLTDPDARAMGTSGKGTAIVGYNVQTAVDTQHHLIVAHDVTNVGHDRDQLSNMAGQAKAAMGVEALDVLADRGYFKGEEVLACEPLGVTPYVPKPLTSGSKA